MKTPKSLRPLQEEGVIDEVLVQLKSGKEATVYLVRCGDGIRAAKLYKDAAQRSFRQASSYMEGRKTRNTRDARAMARGSRFGKRKQEDSWHNAEVDALYKLDAAGVRVPKPYGCFDNVLLMDLVTDDEGQPAPRLCDLVYSEEEALELHQELICEVVRMLCAGVIHGDLSEYNILMDPYGPVIIDLPQAIDASSNPHAEQMLLRDVDNMTLFFAQFAPQLSQALFGRDIWQRYESGELTPDSIVTGDVEEDNHEADLVSVLREIETARLEEEARLARLQEQDDDSER